MSTKNNKFKRNTIILVAFLSFFFYLKADQNIVNLTSSKGLKIKIIKDSSLNFAHAEILIFYKKKIKNPAILYLTIENIFNKYVNRSESKILSNLKKLGNDFEIINRPDFIKIKINFLPDKIALFVNFLKSLYSYRAFTLEKFNRSVSNFWRYFFNNKDWEKKIVFQLAYNKLFSGHLMGDTIITQKLLKQTYLPQLQRFYNNTYKLNNSLLILKGNLDPYIISELLEEKFKSYKKEKKLLYKEKKLQTNKQKQIIILDISKNVLPVVYRFKVIPSLKSKDHITYRIINNILFGFPGGKIFRNSLYFGIRNLKISSEIINHKDVSIICNTIRLNFKDIEKLIFLEESEKKKLKIMKVGRNDYLNSLNYFYGKLKIDSEKFDNDVQIEIDKSLYNLKNNYFKKLPVKFDNIIHYVSLNELNQTISNSITFKNTRRNFTSELIIIVGNAKQILRYFTVLKPEKIEFNAK